MTSTRAYPLVIDWPNRNRHPITDVPARDHEQQGQSNPVDDLRQGKIVYRGLFSEERGCGVVFAPSLYRFHSRGITPITTPRISPDAWATLAMLPARPVRHRTNQPSMMMTVSRLSRRPRPGAKRCFIQA